MKKLLIVSSDTVHVYKYLELISGYFDEVLLLTNRRNPDYKGNVQLVDFSLRNPSAWLGSVRAIRNAIRQFNPTVIHIHQANSYGYYTLRASKGLGIPVVLTAWGSDVLLLPKTNWLMNRMVRWNLKQADALTSDSVYMADEMRRLCGDPDRNILIANFGIDVEPSSEKKEKLIYSNRLHKPLYRIDSILRAFARFSGTDAGREWTLVIAATGEQTEALKNLASQLGVQSRVEFAGWVNKERNTSYYSRASIFVSIPESDATSISLLEAMASGCVPVVSDLPANREWITNGRNGVVVKDLKSDFFSEALKIDLEKASHENLEIIRNQAVKPVCRSRFIGLYDQLIKSRSRQ